MTRFQVLKVTDALVPSEIALGIRRIAPVWGAELSAGAYFGHAAPAVALGAGPMMSPGEVGCALAHLSAYEEVVANQMPALILEADIDARQEHLDAVANILALVPDAPFIHLTVVPARFVFVGRRLSRDPELYRLIPTPDTVGTCAYFVNVDTARRLVGFHRRALRRADSWHDFLVEHRLAAYFAPVFVHGSEVSSIEIERALRRSAPRSPLQRLIAGLLREISGVRLACLRRFCRIPAARTRTMSGGS